MIANSEKMKMKKSYPIFPTDFLKKFLPLPNFFETLSSPLKKDREGVENKRQAISHILQLSETNTPMETFQTK